MKASLGRNALERGMSLLFLLCGIVAVAFVLFISIYLILSGVPAIREVGFLDFLFGKTWSLSLIHISEPTRPY